MPAPDAVSPQTAVLNLSAGSPVQVKTGPSRVYSLSIIQSGPAGSINDVNGPNSTVGVTGAVSLGNQVLSIASGATGIFTFPGGFPCQAGICVTVPASAVYALAYS